jgi:signal transduction histidine kinase
MDGTVGHSGRRQTRFGAWLARAFAWQRLACVALAAVLLSLGALIDLSLLDFFSPVEIALAWVEHLAELAVIGLLLLGAFGGLEQALPRTMHFRRVFISAALLALSAVLALLLHGYYAEGFEHLPPPLRILADSLRWGLPAVFLALIAEVHQRALQIDSAALAIEADRAQLQQGESEQQLALLQAQIEPHFLFNVLANVRRLYRTCPQAGAEAIESLMRYLRSALPQLRNAAATLGDEVASVRAYLELFRLRMGGSLNYSIDVDAALQAVEFPPMLLITLVENAIKHGIEPAGGGRIEVVASRHNDELEVAVLDDGVGFGSAASSGTGVGLVNIRRQLAARYRDRGRLLLRNRAPRGASVAIVIPLVAARAIARAPHLPAEPAV